MVPHEPLQHGVGGGGGAAAAQGGQGDLVLGPLEPARALAAGVHQHQPVRQTRAAGSQAQGQVASGTHLAQRLFNFL